MLNTLLSFSNKSKKDLSICITNITSDKIIVLAVITIIFGAVFKIIEYLK